MSRKTAVAATVEKMKYLPPDNKGVDHMNYLKKYISADIKPPIFRKIERDAIDVARKSGVMDDVLVDALVGSLVIPKFGGIIQAHAINNNLYVDIHDRCRLCRLINKLDL